MKYGWVWRKKEAQSRMNVLRQSSVQKLYTPVHPSPLPLFHSSTLPLFHSSNLPIFQSSTLPPFHPPLLPIFHPSNLPPFHSSILPIFPPSPHPSNNENIFRKILTLITFNSIIHLSVGNTKENEVTTFFSFQIWILSF